MNKLRISLITITAALATVTRAATLADNTVEVTYKNGAVVVNIANNIKQFVTYEATGAHLRLTQSEKVSATVGEITYELSGSSSDGEFYFTGSYKATLSLAGLNLTNPSGPAINIQNGKRIKVSVKRETTNTITDGANDLYNGCLHCKGHTELKGYGTLNINANSKHGIYSKEYMTVKNCVLNINSAPKDGIHCKEYFLMESGTVTIGSALSDGIQVELADTTATGITTDHEDENTGNFYMLDGTLTIKSVGDKCIKTGGTITYSGGVRNFDTSNTATYVTAISTPVATQPTSPTHIYNIKGLPATPRRGEMMIIRKRGATRKVVNR